MPSFRLMSLYDASKKISSLVTSDGTHNNRFPGARRNLSLSRLKWFKRSRYWPEGKSNRGKKLNSNEIRKSPCPQWDLFHFPTTWNTFLKFLFSTFYLFSRPVYPAGTHDETEQPVLSISPGSIILQLFHVITHKLSIIRGFWNITHAECRCPVKL